MIDYRQFTQHQKKFIKAWPQHLRPQAAANLANPNTGWAEIVDDMDESEFVSHASQASSGFCHRYIH